MQLNEWPKQASDYLAVGRERLLVLKESILASYLHLRHAVKISWPYLRVTDMQIFFPAFAIF